MNRIFSMVQGLGGNSFLSDCCGAKSANENVILKCVRELIEHCGAKVDLDGLVLSPLCIAAARGMPSVVKYLLQNGAVVSKKGTGIFHSNMSCWTSPSLSSLRCKNKRFVKGTFTPLEYALEMKKADQEERDQMENEQGTRRPTCREDILLEQCIRILKKAEKK